MASIHQLNSTASVEENKIKDALCVPDGGKHHTVTDR